jgi:hypothetical protein
VDSGEREADEEQQQKVKTTDWFTGLANAPWPRLRVEPSVRGDHAAMNLVSPSTTTSVPSHLPASLSAVPRITEAVMRTAFSHASTLVRIRCAAHRIVLF